ncbi:hypothetical protein AU255_17000 [Methyloprofundus sedimenti]|uniref:Uncharacterized protein n=1 Tax=Methyloprofundus sedimenti TaxID=1420851 RepID=A0A1V8M2V1_9GAMM|nr:UPF0182 family protein [Methyloprofundus sedimenti]OQK15887.1 hypothetical protein AU255_17000 [Methyloprofundus sedimenti]
MKLLFKLIVALLIVGLCAYLTAEFLMEFWWFRSLNLGTYFILRESYEWLVKIGTTILLTNLVYLNFSYMPRALSLHKESDNKGLLAFLQSNKKLLWLISFLLVIPLLIPVYTHWESFLLYYFGAKSELVDPVYAKDISYYFFSYPVYALIQKELLWIFAVLIALLSCLYLVFYKKHKQKLQEFPAAAKLHIAILVAILIFLQIWSIALERIELLYEDRHLPVFFGPGFVEMNHQLPLIILSFILFLGTAVAAIYSLYSGQKYKLAMGFGLAYLLVLTLKQADVIPNLIDDYYVSSNPVQAEAKYIQRHIKATADAFNFDDITVKNYPVVPTLTASISKEITSELDNIPLWDNDLLLSAFEQLQSIRPYFSFYQIAADRYKLGGKNQQVNIAAREIDYQGLAVEAQNWRNRHLVYTHGYGMLMLPSDQQANKPMQWLISDFGQDVKFDKLRIDRPEIYYGLAKSKYAVVPNSESLKPENRISGDMSTDYQGTGGLPLSSLFAKAVVSIFFKDERLFFSAGINNDSRILVRRNIYQRIKEIAPFLMLDNDPYPVLIDHKIYWIVDAYTTSRLYPLVQPVTLEDSEPGTTAEKFNYARNSVKIIIDAYNGSVDFYVVDSKDPLIKTYQRLYPGLFKEFAQVPKPFIKHFRYTIAWFALQMRLYARFHQTDPVIFYQQSAALEFSHIGDKPGQPYYLTLDIEEQEKTKAVESQKFIAVNLFSPLGLDNLYSIAIAGCLKAEHCNEHYQDDIFIYKFPQDVQVEGPAQVSALMNQNPDISRQFSLWNQHGSKVIRGRMIIVFVEHTLLYIQPLYLQSSSAEGFPTLVKVLVALGRHTEIADSLTQAFEKLQKKIMAAQGRIEPISTSAD